MCLASSDQCGPTTRVKVFQILESVLPLVTIEMIAYNLLHIYFGRGTVRPLRRLKALTSPRIRAIHRSKFRSSKNGGGHRPKYGLILPMILVLHLREFLVIDVWLVEYSNLVKPELISS
jgi:hypothetical protein